MLADSALWPVLNGSEVTMVPQEASAVPAAGSRAIHALERAVACATRGIPDRPIVVVGPDDMNQLARQDVRRHLDEVMLGGRPDEGLSALLASGVLDVLLPEVKALVGFGDGEWRHKDVWRHTRQVVRQSECRLEVRWASLFHDIGKVRTRSVDERGEVHFFGHAEVGARMFDRLERREGLFKSDVALKKTVRFLVLHHLRASQYDPRWTDSAVRRFAREMGPHLDALLCLSRADITTKRPEKKRRGVELIDELAQRIGVLALEDSKRPPLPKGVGNALMKAFGLPPSKLVGDIKRALEAAVESEEVLPHQTPAYYVSYVAEHPKRFRLG